ncbi:MAG: CHASE4 domain-containing protein [Candidatus Bathyarchaeia archaeon]|jgi:signal transduction histidine kinase
MKIKSKIIIAIFILCSIVFGALHLTATYLIMPSFEEIEKDQTLEGVYQAVATIKFRLATLQSMVTDYSAWDDTYSFVQTRNQEYANLNLDPAFENLNLNIIAVEDNMGNLLYYKKYDINYTAPIDISQEIDNKITSETALWTFRDIDDKKIGVMLLDGKITLIATSPIVTSQKEGPILGGMLFGNYLDGKEMMELSEITGLDFNFYTLQEFNQKVDGEQIAEALTRNPQEIIVKADSFEVSSGYTLVNCIHGNPLLILQVNQPRETYQHGLVTRDLFVTAALALSIAFGAAVLIILQKQIITPLTNLATSVKSTYSQNPNAKPSPKGDSDEVSVLAEVIKDSFNQKLETMNEVSRMVAHDLRNPLTGIKGAAYSLKRNYSQEIGEKGLGLLKVIDDCVDYSNKIVSDLWEYSSEIKLEKTKTSPYRLVIKALATIAVPSNINIINYASSDFGLNVDTGKIERVFSNLIKNAIDAMPNGGTLNITTQKLRHETVIIFKDNGVGMSEEIVEKLGNPFFTTKAKGMGVGFSICKRIVEAHQGKIEVESTPRVGTRISVFLS